jgi:hypothetical protein
MKGVLGCLLLPATLLAQTLPEQRLVDQLSEDLISLTSLRGMSEGSVVVNPRQLTSKELARLKAAVKDQTPELDGIMMRFAAHVAERYDRFVVPWSLAYVLTSTLAGKRLPQSVVKQLAASIVAALDSAVVCRQTSTLTWNCAQFRASAKSAHDTLLALGVAPPNARIVIENLIFAGDLIVQPRRIEPIYPTQERRSPNTPKRETIQDASRRQGFPMADCAAS